VRQMPRRFAADVGAALPSLIRDLHASIDAGRDVPELLSLAVIVHVQVTHTWLRLAGASPDLRRDAARLARQAAQERGDVAALGVATYGTVYALVGSGMFDLAQASWTRSHCPRRTGTPPDCWAPWRSRMPTSLRWPGGSVTWTC
jgi:hypothetical protein